MDFSEYLSSNYRYSNSCRSLTLKAIAKTNENLIAPKYEKLKEQSRKEAKN